MNVTIIEIFCECYCFSLNGGLLQVQNVRKWGGIWAAITIGNVQGGIEKGTWEYLIVFDIFNCKTNFITQFGLITVRFTVLTVIISQQLL